MWLDTRHCQKISTENITFPMCCYRSALDRQKHVMTWILLECKALQIYSLQLRDHAEGSLDGIVCPALSSYYLDTEQL